MFLQLNDFCLRMKGVQEARQRAEWVVKLQKFSTVLHYGVLICLTVEESSLFLVSA